MNSQKVKRRGGPLLEKKGAFELYVTLHDSHGRPYTNRLMIHLPQCMLEN